MRDYVIITDSSCDIEPKLLAEWEVPFVSLTYKFDEDQASHGNYDLPFPHFYERMRKGSVARPAAANMEIFKQAFEPYLKRGGRVSAAAAFVGGVLNIKPVLHMDNPGHLINMFKVRGRRASIKALADKYGELALHPGPEDTVFISHGDCIDDAKLLEKMLAERYHAKVQLITYVGPVIGSHSGPGTLALFFLGRER